jgi:hypothetical protein
MQSDPIVDGAVDSHYDWEALRARIETEREEIMAELGMVERPEPRCPLTLDIFEAAREASHE